MQGEIENPSRRTLLKLAGATTATLAGGGDAVEQSSMHNAGLFDEYKDVTIESDPKENSLITVR